MDLSRSIWFFKKYLEVNLSVEYLHDICQKSDNLQYNTEGQWVDRTIVIPSDGSMFILIDWEQFGETVGCWLGLRAYQTVDKELDSNFFKL